MSTPSTLFHITKTENLSGILTEGFKAPFGNYFSGSMENAGKFIGLRAMLDPDLTWVAIEVDPAGLDVKQSADHNPEFFGTDDSWVIDEPISPDHFIDVYEVTFGKPADTSEGES